MEIKETGTKSKTVPKPPSPVTIPPAGNSNPVKPVAVKVSAQTRHPQGPCHVIDYRSSELCYTVGKSERITTVKAVTLDQPVT